MMRRKGIQTLAAAAIALAVGFPLAAAMYETLTVQEGDTLWDLSREHLGDALRFPEWVDINDLRSGGNPHLIYPGEVLNIPGSEMEPEPEPEPMEVEVPVPMVEQMLNDLGERLAEANQKLEHLKEQVEHVDEHVHDKDFAKLLKNLESVRKVDLSSIEKKIARLENSVNSKVQQIQKRSAEQHKMAKGELDAIKKELASLMAAVKMHEEARVKAVEELASKMMELHAPVNPIGEVEQPKRTVGMVAFLTVGVAWLVLSTSR